MTHLLFIIIDILHHKNATRKGLCPPYCTEAVLDGSQMSNNFWIYDCFVLVRCPSRRQILILLIHGENTRGLIHKKIQ